MITTVSPQEAVALIDRSELDVVDVRDAREFSSGHIPRARLVPLQDLRTNPGKALLRDGVVFVCAKGVRSLTAAKLAEALGFTRLYSVAGGTAGWTSAGLPLVQG